MVLAKLIDYYDFIIDSDENLNRRIFDSNVRDYLGLNPVNADIMKSLADSDNPEFWWFNNGITIIGTQAHIVGNAISIENAQIVNGLQTSESIFNHFSDVGQKDDKRSVLIKIIITNDLNVRNAIIYATNNQTNVNGRPRKGERPCFLLYPNGGDCEISDCPGRRFPASDRKPLPFAAPV